MIFYHLLLTICGHINCKIYCENFVSIYLSSAIVHIIGLDLPSATNIFIISYATQSLREN